MIQKKSAIKFLLPIFFIVFIGQAQSVFSSELKGKVINIDSKKKAVFIDLGKSSVNIGDHVRVSNGYNLDVLLKVVGTSDKFSKLMVDEIKYPVDQSLFEKIIAGDEAVKFDSRFQREEEILKKLEHIEYGDRDSTSMSDDSIHDLVSDIQNIVTGYSDDGQEQINISADNDQCSQELEKYKMDVQQLQSSLTTCKNLNQKSGEVVKTKKEIESEIKDLADDLKDLNESIPVRVAKAKELLEQEIKRLNDELDSKKALLREKESDKNEEL